MIVKITSIAQELECIHEEFSAFLNRETGEILQLQDDELAAGEEDEPLEDFPEWQQENIQAAKEIAEDSGKYVRLPGKFEINEYSIMEDFILSLKDQRVVDRMYDSIKGKGAFRRFRQDLERFDLLDDWYRFREEAFTKIAIEWCERKGIPYEI